MSDRPTVNFNEINPTPTEYHKVKTRIITPRISAVEISTPFNVNNPAIEPSVIPIPPGMNDMAPKRVEVVYIARTFK